MKKFALLAILASALFVACDNEIDVNAPFSETTILYSTLNVDDTQHYLRVTRAYLGQDGVNGGNQEGDSLYYDDIVVELKEFNEVGQNTRSLTAVEDNSVTLDEGFFTTDGYVIYRVDATLNEDYTYRVVITRSNGDIVRSETPLVHDFEITKPRFPSFNPAGPNGTQVEWEQAVNGRVYRAYAHLQYVEFPRNNKADSVRAEVTYTFPYETGDNLNGIGIISKGINYNQFYGNIAAQLDPPTGNRIRIARQVVIEVIAGGDDLATHINVTQPQTGILQDPPFFTNVEGGAGILSSIHRQFPSGRKRLSNLSLEALVYGPLTCDLRFGEVTTSDTLFCQP